MKKFKPLIIFTLLILLSGCKDNVELENRAFAISLGIDKFSDKEYAVTLEIPQTTVKEAENAGKIIKSSKGETLTEAVYGADDFLSRSVYLGQTKLALISEDILKDEELLKQLTKALSNENDISRKIIILTCKGKALDILEEEFGDKRALGVYISDFYKKNTRFNNSIMDLDKLIKDLAENNFAVIPRIEIEEKEIKFNGAAVIKDFKYAGELDEKVLRGFLFANGKGKDAKITCKADNYPVTVNVKKQKTDIEFFQESSGLSAIIKIKVNGIADEILEEAKTADFKEKINKAAAEIITDEIKSAYKHFYSDIDTDGFLIKRNLEKKDTNLYKVYFENMKTNVKDIKIYTDVKVEIE